MSEESGVELVESRAGSNRVDTASEALHKLESHTRARVEEVSLRFSDPLGTVHQFNIPEKLFNDSLVANGLPFDGSSIRMWKSIHESDMLAMPDISSLYLDPFAETIAVVMCSIKDPISGEMYEMDPRTIAQRAEKFLQDSGNGDEAYFGPECEFFIFDHVKYYSGPFQSGYKLMSTEAWDDDNSPHKIPNKGGYAPTAPFDTMYPVRSKIRSILEKVGIEVECHHHEVSTAGQCEINIKFDSLTRIADKTQTYKYIVRNVAKQFGKTATFMPKPLFNDNGSGMHVHMSISKEWDDEISSGPANRFAPFEGREQYTGYGGLSQTAMWAIGGVLEHAPALIGLTNPTTNSFKRLVPGFEAPVNLTYAMRNRSAAVRIPYVGDNAKAKRFEFRCPDGMSNPYLAFSALLMAMIDGIDNQIDPGDYAEQDLFESDHDIPQIPGTLDEALERLSRDRAFLTRGGVFTDAFIDAWIKQKRGEIRAVESRPHPHEFDMYYNA